MKHTLPILSLIALFAITGSSCKKHNTSPNYTNGIGGTRYWSGTVISNTYGTVRNIKDTFAIKVVDGKTIQLPGSITFDLNTLKYVSTDANGVHKFEFCVYCNFSPPAEPLLDIYYNPKKDTIYYNGTYEDTSGNHQTFLLHTP